MSFAYERLPDPGAGLRLHLNENTAGCSPRVLDAMRRVTAHEAAFYPDYERPTRAMAVHLGLSEGEVLLVNGLDEGIHATAFAYLPRTQDGRQRDAVIVEPAFDMYAACADAAGGRVVQVRPRPDFAFPIDDVLGAIGPVTGVVFLTSPGNPTGLSIDHRCVRQVAQRLPDDAVLFLDEAYVEFGGESFLRQLPAFPNVIIGRTFAKTRGLAAVRLGAVAGAARTIERLRRVVPPYSVNIFALAALQAALDDDQWLAWYVAESQRSRALIYQACERHGLRYWPSDANFVLVRIGPRAGALAAALARRGIFVRDRSRQPGCEGCLRITAGVVDHTAACLAALEEELCAAG